MVMTKREDPIHSIVERPWEYEILSLSFYQSPSEEFEPFIDLTLKKGDVLRHLRFYSPRELEIEKGFPARTGGFCIYDVSARGLEGLGVRVGDFEVSWGAVRFWAREVIEIGQFQKAHEA
jgi:hypothetical protein